MDTQRKIDRTFVATTWAIGLIGTAVLTSLILFGVSLVDRDPISVDSFGDIGRFGISAALGTFISVMLIGAYRLRSVRDPHIQSSVIAGLHVATFIAVYLIDVIARAISETQGTSVFETPLSSHAGPAAAVVGIMSVAAIAASMLALNATATEDEISADTFN
ncbi:MAG: hypothetical protein ABI200_07760 [Gaiellales bacterium]